MGSNRAPVRLWSSPYILLSVGRCRVLSGAIGTPPELLGWAVGRAAFGVAGALVFSPRELIWGSAGDLGGSGGLVLGSGNQGLKGSEKTWPPQGRCGLLWAPLGSGGRVSA